MSKKLHSSFLVIRYILKMSWKASSLETSHIHIHLQHQTQIRTQTTTLIKQRN